MVDTLKLPEKVRAAMAESLLEVQRAEAEFRKLQAALQKQAIIACELLGLDSSLNHQINFDTGVITPAAAPPPPVTTTAKILPGDRWEATVPTKPELVKPEEAS